MTKRVLIIGGYGNFGSIIARRLALDANIQVVIGGRSIEKAKKFAATLKKAAVPPEAVKIDITEDLAATLIEIGPDIVIHTTGPFQFQGYTVAEICIRHGYHYIDLADSRSFVAGFSQFDQLAKEKGVLAVTGASSVPALTAAVLDHYRTRFATIEKIDYGISAAQQTSRGLATMLAVLSYVGEPFMTLVDGKEKKVFGWQNLHLHRYPQLGWRFLGNCDIPDLELFPARYPDLHTIRFYAGTELAFLHIGLWLLSWPIRAGIIPPLDHVGGLFLRVSRWFDRFSKKRSGFHMLMYGTAKSGEPRAEAFYIVAHSGYGINIPCIPAVVIAKRLAAGTLTETGARPCLDMIDLKTYTDTLKGLDIEILRDIPIKPLKAKAPPKVPAKPKIVTKPGTKPAAATTAKPDAQPVVTPSAKPAAASPDDAAIVATPSVTIEAAAKPEVSSYDEAPDAYSYKRDASVPAFPDDKPLFVFDGVCVMCSRGAAWLMGKSGDTFRYASAQSPLGQALYSHYGLEPNDTYLLIDEGKVYIKSDGYFRISQILGKPWIYIIALQELPLAWRDKVYDYVARNRYKWFGKTEEPCELIPEEYKANMLG